MRRRGVLVATISAFVLAAGFGGEAASAKVPRDFYGIVHFAPLSSSDYALMGQARVGTMRIQLLWGGIQRTQNGPYNFSATDATVAGAASQGISILPTMFGTPPFEAHGCSSQTCQRHIQTSSKALKAWQAFVTASVQRYGPNGTFWQTYPSVPYHPITKWQLWNEQNNPKQKNSPKAYTKLVKASDTAIHAVDPSADVVLGGMFATPPGAPQDSAWNYLKSMYKAGAGGHFQGVALHPYAVKPSGLAQPIKRMRKTMKSHHEGSTPLYITEIGWGSSTKKHPGTGGRGAQFNVSPAKQKAYLSQAFKILTSNRSSWKIGGVFWFTWKDPTNPPPGLCAFCYSAGLVKSNGKTAKPSLSAFESFTKKTSGKRARSVATPARPRHAHEAGANRRTAGAAL